MKQTQIYSISLEPAVYKTGQMLADEYGTSLSNLFRCCIISLSKDTSTKNMAKNAIKSYMLEPIIKSLPGSSHTLTKTHRAKRDKK